MICNWPPTQSENMLFHGPPRSKDRVKNENRVKKDLPHFHDFPKIANLQAHSAPLNGAL